MTGERGVLRRPGTWVWPRLRNSLWPLPVLAIVIAIGLGIGLPALDQILQEPGGTIR